MRVTRPRAILALTVLLLAAGLIAPSPRPVEAHAAIVSSSPAANEVLDAAPQRVQITFSERLVESVSVIEVLDASGTRVDMNDSRRVEGDLASLVVSLQPGLADGIYTVAWRNISDVDGHPRSGSFVFFVGEASFDTVTEVPEPPLFASPLEPVLRWIVLVSGILLAGAPAAYAFVLGRFAPRDVSTPLRWRVEAVALAGGGAMLAAGLAQIAVQIDTTGLDAGTIIGETTWGHAWMARLVLGAIAVATYLMLRSRPASRWARLVAGSAGALALASVSLASHAAATPGVEAVATLVDVAHLLAAAVWGGGLVAFLLLLAAVRGGREEASTLRAAMPRFSVLGLISTAVLFVTGAYSSWLQLVTAEALTTPYGLGVLVKVAALAVLVGLGAANLFWVRRQVEGRATASRGATWLGRIMRVEVAGILVAVVAAGTIASLEPGRQVVTRTQAGELASTGQDGDLEIELAVRPGTVGLNEVVATLSRRGDAYENATTVNATLSFIGQELGDTPITLIDRGDGEWAAEGVVLSIGGEYQLSALVQRTDGFDARHAFRFQTAGATSTLAADPVRAWRIGAIVLVGVGTALILGNWLGSRKRVVRGETLGWAGASVCAVALVLAGRAPDPTLALTNPRLPVPASIEAGRTTYQANCAVCHGDTGAGDGTAAGTTPAPVADLRVHVPLHTDGELFTSIRRGAPFRGMPEWEGVLTEAETWDLVNYLRELTRPTANQAP